MSLVFLDILVLPASPVVASLSALPFRLVPLGIHNKGGRISTRICFMRYDLSSLKAKGRASLERDALSAAKLLSNSTKRFFASFARLAENSRAFGAIG